MKGRLSASGRLPVILSCSPPFGAFEGTDGDGDANVYRACSGDATGLATEISNFDDGGLTSEGCHNPVLSPDGSKILFEVSNPDTGFTDIWVVSSTPGSTATQLVSDAASYCIHPSWGPDSDTFAYVKTPNGSLFSGGSILKDTVSSPGSPTTLKATSGGFSPYRPLFSGGGQIAYFWNKDTGGSADLRIMDADGSNDASLDNTLTEYRVAGPQHGWSNDSSMLAYDDGASSANKIYVIGADGTGKTQINASGDASGLQCRVSDRSWPTGDGYVVISVRTSGLAVGTAWCPARAELDGSDTTTLLADRGAWNGQYFQHVLLADSRIWFIESAVLLSSIALDGTDYRTDLTIDGAAMGDFSNGDGWFYN